MVGYLSRVLFLTIVFNVLPFRTADTKDGNSSSGNCLKTLTPPCSSLVTSRASFLAVSAVFNSAFALIKVCSAFLALFSASCCCLCACCDFSAAVFTLSLAV